MKTNKDQIQQGDVLLQRIAALPAGCKIIKDKRGVVLAEGEHTGHYHGITAGGTELLEAPDKTRYTVNSGDRAAPLDHQEHKPVTVDPGIWRVGIVREKDWFTEMVRNVVD